ncbi:hypothetical protein AB4Y87_24625 [Paenarthrobacter sp. RAF54_2]|uniref:hypothetical protein n=1 Tax=Paenarthrobacter sp. RAF54_2 TaxID=3233061 RepID=UPI003F958F92
MASTTDDWSTDIAEVHDDDVLIRGHLLTTMIGKRGFGELACLLISGRWPMNGQAHVLEGKEFRVRETRRPGTDRRIRGPAPRR